MPTYDPTDLRGQERDKAEAQAKARQARKQEDDDFKWLMSMKRGRAIVWRLLSEAGVYRLSFNPNALTMAFNEGNRQYGNKVLARATELCPDLYVKMTEEQNVRTDDGNGDHSH